MFNGDRIGQCSNPAKMAWPWIFLASNGYARFEINYLRIAAKCFSSFHPCPTKEEVYGWIGEYIDAGLLFVWPVGRQLWGQWNTPCGLMPKFKTRKDNESPTPKDSDITAWISSYRAGGKGFVKLLGNVFETFLSSIEEVVGIGIEVGIENISASDPDAGGLTSNLRSSYFEISESLVPPATTGGHALDHASFSLTGPSADPARPGRKTSDTKEFKAFWELRWRSEDRKAAVIAFGRIATNSTKISAIMAAASAQRQDMLTKDRTLRPYMSTWLNKERWNDEDEPPDLIAIPRSISSAESMRAEALKLLKEGRNHAR